jgi:hypothetical protein
MSLFSLDSCLCLRKVISMLDSRYSQQWQWRVLSSDMWQEVVWHKLSDVLEQSSEPLWDYMASYRKHKQYSIILGESQTWTSPLGWTMCRVVKQISFLPAFMQLKLPGNSQRYPHHTLPLLLSCEARCHRLWHKAMLWVRFTSLYALLCALRFYDKLLKARNSTTIVAHRFNSHEYCTCWQEDGILHISLDVLHVFHRREQETELQFYLWCIRALNWRKCEMGKSSTEIIDLGSLKLNIMRVPICDEDSSKWRIFSVFAAFFNSFILTLQFLLPIILWWVWCFLRNDIPKYMVHQMRSLLLNGYSTVFNCWVS